MKFLPLLSKINSLWSEVCQIKIMRGEHPFFHAEIKQLEEGRRVLSSYLSDRLDCRD